MQARGATAAGSRGDVSERRWPSGRAAHPLQSGERSPQFAFGIGGTGRSRTRAGGKGRRVEPPGGDGWIFLNAAGGRKGYRRFRLFVVPGRDTGKRTVVTATFNGWRA